MSDSQDKVAVVAGGGSIGGATARALARAGFSVVIGDLDGANADSIADGITQSGGSARGLQVDISDEASASALVAQAVDAYGGLDGIFINAADMSVILQDSDALQIDLDVFDQTIRVNLRGHLICTRAALPELIRRGAGSIVYTSSGAAFAGEAQRPCYAMAKAGINALARHVASRWGRQGIRANAVAPGFVVTDNNRKTLPPKFLEQASAHTRSHRPGQPEDIAAMAAFLLGDQGSWINGQVIGVDGGALLR